MINLITGTPGSGKTAYALKFMLDQLKGSKRKVYVHGIPDLKIPHEKVYCSSKNCDVCSMVDQSLIHPSLLADQWHEYAPDGAVYFFDECQNIYRPRNSASKVPDSVQAFEVHRHRGLDFFLITQAPSLIDSNIRALVSRHIHLKPTWLGRYQYEWPECKASVQSTTDAIKSKYHLDKKVFKLYKSASIHTKQQRKIPFILYILIFTVLSVFGLSYRVYARVSPNLKNESVSQDSLLKQSSTGAEIAPAVAVPVDEKYTYQELMQFSYSADFLDKSRLPTFCYFTSQTSYKCSVSRIIHKRFKSSYCVSDVCYFFIDVKTGLVKESV